MLKITIEGTVQFDGTFDLDLDARPLNHWDTHVIKNIADVRGGQLSDALAEGDTDLIVALAVIALERAGKITKKEIMEARDVIYEAPLGKIALIDDATEEAADAVPPPSEPAANGDANATNGSSGASTNGTPGGSQETTRIATGPLV